MGDDTELEKRVGQLGNELQAVELSKPGYDGTAGAFGWHARCDGSDTWAEYGFSTNQPMATTVGRLGGNLPDIYRLFVRDTEPANKYDIGDGTDLWIDTGS